MRWLEVPRAKSAAFARSVAGPLLITASVIFVMRGIAFRGLMSVSDVVRLWLPQYCFLGKMLASGHIPSWNPYLMAGMPFASDPQSGWMSLSVMALFTGLPCGAAIGFLTVLYPVSAGVGLFWFLRIEGVSRPAATAGGATLALAIAGSRLAVALPFSGVLAWTTLSLALCGKFLRASRWSARLGWGVLVAIACGQLLVTHLVLAAFLAAPILTLYVLGRLSADVTGGRRSPRVAAAYLAVLIVLVGSVSLGVLAPRLAYRSSTSLGLGYTRLAMLDAQLRGVRFADLPLGRRASLPTWPLKLVATPGARVAALVLSLSFAGWWSRRFRSLAFIFGAYGVLGYVGGLKALAERVPPSLRSIELVDLYRHNPSWLNFSLYLSLGVLGAIGLDSWRERRGVRARGAMLLPALVVWGLLPPVLGASFRDLLIAAVAGTAGLAFLVAASRPGERWVLSVAPVLVVLEVIAATFVTRGPYPFEPLPYKLDSLPRPTIDVGRYEEPGAIASVLQSADDGRYAVVGASPFSFDRRTDQAILFRTETVDGYNAVQLLRYWTFVRAAQSAKIRYNLAYFTRPPPQVLNLLQVAWIVGRDGHRPPATSGPVVRQGEEALYRVNGPSPRASVVPCWKVARGPDAARRVVLEPGFDPSVQVVLEKDPGLGRPSCAETPGVARFTWQGPSAATVRVTTRTPAMVLVRNAYDPNWRAFVDGHRVPVLPADAVVQGIPVPAGNHVIFLRYRDPWLPLGLLFLFSSLAVALMAALVARVRENRRGPAGSRTSPSAQEQGRSQQGDD